MFFDPYSDYGFKKLFGEERSKDILIDFLNTMLPKRHQIVDLTFTDKELVPGSIDDRRGFCDIFCTAVNGDRFIVEMQKARFATFKERALIYSFWALENQIKRGNNWGRKKRFSSVYFIGILNFLFDKEFDDDGLPVPNKLYTNVRLRDDDNTLFYSGLTMKFLQMPLFQKTENELESRFDKWLYFLKNLPSFEHIPRILNEPVFTHAFEVAKIGNMSQDEFDAYKKISLDIITQNDIINTAIEEAKEEAKAEAKAEGEIKGKAEGKAEGVIEGENKAKRVIIKNLLAKKFPIDEIAQTVDLSVEDVERLLS
jgi:predicted transposase/invertase (TIGR01784 family)